MVFYFYLAVHLQSQRSIDIVKLMKINSDTLPVILGSSIILLVFMSVGGMLISYGNTRAAQEKQDLQDSFAAYHQKQKDKLKISAPPLPPAQGTKDALESGVEPGELRIGSYSNPPTEINSFGSRATTSRIEPPLGDRFSNSSSPNSLTRTHSDFNIGNSRSSLTNNYSSDASRGNENLVDSLETDTSLGFIDSTSNNFKRSDDNSGIRIDALEAESRF